MVILFSNRKNKTEKEIIKILTANGADYISDKSVIASGGFFTVAAFYKPIKMNLKKGIILFLDDTERFSNQNISEKIICICEDCNLKAIEIFEKNKVSVIVCGNNSKSTVTLSSVSKNKIMFSLQRTIRSVYGNKIFPCDIIVKIKNNYSNISILYSILILLLYGIIPEEI